MLRDVNDLKQQIERILDILDAERDASPAAWFWPTMSDQEREAKFSELYDWVETVLREQYPNYLADHIKPCWPNHPEARWELTWLYRLWTGRQGLPAGGYGATAHQRIPLVFAAADVSAP